MSKITKEDIQGASRALLEVLAKGISDIKGLERLMGRTLPGRSAGDEIFFQMCPSNGATDAYGISYVSNGKGMPVEIKVNPQMGYTSFIVKSDCEWSGYEPFVTDDSNNIAQQKKFGTTDIAGVRRELESLAKEE